MASAENPTGVVNVEELPDDHVALLVWRKEFGTAPLTVVVSRASWDMNKQALMDDGYKFDHERVYEFESPINATGRKSIFHFEGVIGWIANVGTGIITTQVEAE